MNARRAFVLLLLTVALSALCSTAWAADPYAFSVNTEEDTVTVVEAFSGQTVTAFAVGDWPHGIYIDEPRARAYVTNRGADTVSVVDTSLLMTIGSIPVGDGPYGVAVHPFGTYAYVANHEDGTLSVVDTALMGVVATVTVGGGPVGVAMSPDGSRVYVANQDFDTVSVVSTATNTLIATLNTGDQPFGLAVNPAGTRLFVTNSGSGNVSIFDTATFALVSTVAVGAAPRGIDFNSSGTKAYIANNGSDSVTVIDTATNTVDTTIAVSAGPSGVTLDASDTRLFVGMETGVDVVNTFTDELSTTYTNGQNNQTFGHFVSEADFSPRVIATSPASGATNVRPEDVETIEAMFNVALDPDSVGTEDIRVAPKSTGSVAYDGATRSVVITLDQELDYSQTYTVVVENVQDTVGNPSKQYVWSFSTLDGNADLDGDGANNQVDQYPNNPALATVTSVNGTGTLLVDTTTFGGSLQNVRAISPDDTSLNQANRPSNYAFPDGMVAFEIHNIAQGATVTMNLQFLTTSTPDADTKVFKVTSDGFVDWTSLSTINGQRVTLTLTDGGQGDADGEANGVIVDPVGLGYYDETVVIPEEANSGMSCVYHPAAGFSAEWMLLGLPLLGYFRRKR